MKKFWKRTLCLALTLVLSAGLLTAFSLPAAATTIEEKQRAIILTALAYFDKGRPVQYDSAQLSAVNKAQGGTLRSTHAVAPEYATPDETCFSVCSDFCYQVYFDTFRYKICGHPIACYTGRMSTFEPGTDLICAYKYDSKVDKKTTRANAITQFLAALQPGDVINAVSEVGAGGHAMLYVGDYYGNGKNYLIQCSGHKYQMNSGVDYVEGSADKLKAIPGKIEVVTDWNRNDGAISFDSAEEYLRTKYENSKSLVLSIIRPLNEITDSDYPLTDAAKGRMQFPRLVYNRTANATRFNDVEEGSTLTLSIEIKNCSKDPYKLPVEETIPAAGVTFVKASDGATVADNKITWTIDLPAGQAKTMTVDYTVTAKRGETITLGDGKLGMIPSNTLRIPVGGKHLNDEEKARLAAIAIDPHKNVPTDIKEEEFAQRIYRDVLKLDVEIPTAKVFVKNVLKKETTGDRLYNPRKDLQGELRVFRQMLVPEFAGGARWGELDDLHRILDLKCKYLEPGDILVQIPDATITSISKSFVYAGNDTFLTYDQDTVGTADFFELQKSHLNDLFYVLRPTLAYDDIHTPETTSVKEFKFTDVKESDWFYTYVKDLVEDGTVNGMTETTFVPNGTLTYGQALKLITLAVGEKEQEKTGTHWASGYLTLAKSKGWLAEDVNLDGTITRLQLCKVAAKAKGLTEQPAANPFTDTSDPDVLALNKVGVINGMTATEFQPNGLLTRAQISKIIWTLRKV